MGHWSTLNGHLKKAVGLLWPLIAEVSRSCVHYPSITTTPGVEFDVVALQLKWSKSVYRSRARYARSPTITFIIQ